MSAPPSRQGAAGRAYIDLQKRARETGRPTQQLLQLYLLESFLRRLAGSQYRAGSFSRAAFSSPLWGTVGPRGTSTCRPGS